MVEVVPSQERIASPLIDVEPSTAGHEYVDVFPDRIEESFQKSLPSGVFVNLVQDNSRFLLRRGNREFLPKTFRVFDNELPMTFNVPVEIERFHPDFSQEMLRQGCFAYLPRSCDEGHLELFSKESSDFRGKVAHRKYLHMSIKMS